MRKQSERKLDEELRYHLDRQIELNLAAGMSPRAARRAAMVAFGGLDQLKEETRALHPGRLWSELRQDLRFALRTLRRSPGFAAVAILTLALGVGLNTAFFTLLNAAVLRPLPVPGAGRLVSVAQTISTDNHSEFSRNVHDDDTFVSYSEYRHYAAGQTVFTGLVAYEDFLGTNMMTDHPVPVLGTVASCNYFEVLEVSPTLGRGFQPDECAQGARAAVVVLSHRFWTRQFGADRAILGKSITLNRTPFRVIGVAPPGFDGTTPIAAEFWAPLAMESALNPAVNQLADDNLSWLALLGRLRPGVSRAQAQAALGVLASQLNRRQPHRVTRVALAPATLAAMPSMRGVFLVGGGIILTACGLILLLACANLASLLLARASRRQHELAVRRALGASRGRLIRQLLTEGLLLGALGGALGALAAALTAPALLQALLSHLPLLPEMRFSLHVVSDWRTAGFALAVSLAAVCLAALAPARRASRAEAAPGQLAGQRLRNALVAAQAALCMVLLLAAALMLRALQRMDTVNPGFRTANLETVAYDLAAAGYGDLQAESAQARLRAALAAIPGVEGVAQTTVIPLSGEHDMTSIANAAGLSASPVEFASVSTNYFSVLGMRLLQGRMPANAQQAVVNRALARWLWPVGAPLGQTIRRGKHTWQVVGEVADAQLWDLGVSDTPAVFWPTDAATAPSLNLVLRSAGPVPGLEPQISAAVAAMDPRLAVAVAPMSNNLETERIPARVVSALAAGLGGLALSLALLGIYGMVAYRMQARLRELGVRLALGANRGELLLMVVRQALAPVGIGLAVGLTLGALMSLALGSASAALGGLSPWDATAYIGAPLLLLAAATAASVLAAHRALSSDPVASLRTE